MFEYEDPIAPGEPKKTQFINRRMVFTDCAPPPIGACNQAVRVDNTLYVSGCLGMDKETMQLVPGGIAEQTEMALKNMEGIINAAGSKIDFVVKCTLYLTDMCHIEAVDEIYSKVFDVQEHPARSCVEVARLPMDALIQIDCIAMVGDVLTVFDK